MKDMSLPAGIFQGFQVSRTPKRLLLPVILLASIPLVYPLIVSDRFLMFTPASISLLATGLLLAAPSRLIESLRGMAIPLLAPSALIAAIAFGHFLSHGTYKLEDLGFSLIWLALPLFAYVNATAMEWLMVRFLCIFWAMNFIVSLPSLLYGVEMFGVPGNRNWHSSLLILCTPFMAIELHAAVSRRFPSLPQWLRLSIASIPALPSLWMFCLCHSRGGWLAAGVAFAALIFLESSAKVKRLIAWGGLTMALLLAALLVTKGFDSMVTIFSEDERLPLWEGVLNLASDNPVFGVGQASFESEFMRYRPLSYFLNKHAAVRSNHPHNNLLFMLASFGAIGLAAWLTLLVPTFCRLAWGFKELDTTGKTLLLAAAAVFLHGMFDLVLFEWPTSIMALLCLGLLWARAWPPATDPEAPAHGRGMRTLKLSAGICSAFFMALVAVSVFRTASFSWHFWKATVLASAMRQEHDAASMEYFRASRLWRGNPYCLYRGATNAYINLRDRRMCLYFLGMLDETPNRNFAHSNAFRGKSLIELGRHREAMPSLVDEAACYPLTILRLMSVSKGSHGYDQTNAVIEEMARIRGLDMEALKEILDMAARAECPWDEEAKDGTSQQRK